ncbi:MAG: PorV/PorQ family protein [Bacteroidota bacterium]
MRTVLKISLTLALVCANPSSLVAQFDNVGTSAMNFLKIGVGARAVAMGSSQVAVVNDASSLYWNPSGMANITANQVLMSNNNWIADISHNFLAVVVPSGEFGVIGISVSYLSMGDMKVTTWDQTDGTGEIFSSHSAAIGFGWARQMSDRFKVGVHLKYLNESIANSSANTFAVDLGSQYDIGWLRVGMSIQNFGPQARMEGRDLLVRFDPLPDVGSNPPDVTANLETQEWALPILFQLGFAVTPLRTEMMRLTTSIDFRDERDYRPQLGLGGEFAFEEMIFLRGGIKNRVISEIVNLQPELEETYLVSAGVGVAYTLPTTEFTIHFDYAYQQLQYFSNSQLITLRVDF